MMQSLLFNQPPQDTTHTVLEKDGRVVYMPEFFNKDQSTLFFHQLIQSLDWQADQIMMFGKMITTKRKVVWVGDSDCSYTYSGVKKNPEAWTTELLQMKAQLEKLAGCVFNSCLLNLYHSGEEGMGWHSDDEKELDPKAPIASVSLGASRKFAFRHKIDKTKASIILENGSVLMMHPPTQEYWSHSLVTTKLATPARINLTFRSIKNESRK
jgi:alkylated DNA repair dioxygenase AlkB